VDEFLQLKENIKKLEAQVSDLNLALKPVVEELNEVMETMDLHRFEGTKGKITRVKIDYVNSPATDEDKAQFFEYLRKENLFDAMASVHYQKLNSFYKDKLEQAIEAGEELYIPGLEPKQRVEIRKGR
jgi:hypothetical protein